MCIAVHISMQFSSCFQPSDIVYDMRPEGRQRLVATEDQPSADRKRVIGCSTGIPDAEGPPVKRSTGNAVPLGRELRSGPYWPSRNQNIEPSSAQEGVILEVRLLTLLVAFANGNSGFVDFDLVLLHYQGRIVSSSNRT